MPKQVTRGEDGTRVRLEGLPYAQVPDMALKLSGPAYKILGRLQRLAGTRTSVEVEDQDLGQWIKRSRKTVQRAWVELERAGLVARRHHGGRRRIVLLYTLAGRETKAGQAAGKLTHACVTERQTSETHACVENDARMRQKRRTRVSEMTHPLKREREEKTNTPGDGGQASLGPPPPPGGEGAPELTPAQWWAAFRRQLGGPESPASKATGVGTSTQDPRRPR